MIARVLIAGRLLISSITVSEAIGIPPVLNDLNKESLVASRWSLAQTLPPADVGIGGFAIDYRLATSDSPFPLVLSMPRFSELQQEAS